MRKLLVLGVVLVAFALVLPFSMGVLAKNRLTKMVNQINNQSPNVKVSIDKYNRGWLSSQADFKFAISVANNPALQQKLANNEITFTVREDIKHGPIIFRDGIQFGQGLADGHIVLDDDVKAKINALFKDQKEKPTMDFHILIKLFGSTVTKLDVPAFTYVVPQKKGEIKWKGLQGKWKLSSNMKKADGHLTFSGFNVSSPRIEMEFANMAVKFRQHEHDSGLWIGKGSMTLPMIKVSEMGQEKFLLTDLSMNSHSDINGELMMAGVDTKLGKVMLNGVTYGPGEFITNLNNLDVATLVQIRDKVNAINQASVPAGQRRMMAMSLLPMLPKLLDKGAEIQLDKFSFKFPEGDVTANGYAKLNKATPGNNLPMPLGLKTRLDAKFDLSVPKTLARKAMTLSNMRKIARKQAKQMYQQQQMQQHSQAAMDPNQAAAPQAMQQYQPLNRAEMQSLAVQTTEQQLALWISNGMLKEVGENYQVSIIFKDGRLLINGAPPKVGFLPVPGAKVVRVKPAKKIRQVKRQQAGQALARHHRPEAKRKAA